MNDTADRGDLRRTAMSERNNTGKPVWRFPETWKITSKRGYWKRTAVPLLESEYKGFGLKVATQRYINPYENKQTRTGSGVADDDLEEGPAVIDPPQSSTRLYPGVSD